MKNHRLILLIILLSIACAACYMPCEGPYIPPSTAEINIKRWYDDRNNDYGSAVTVEATFQDRYAGKVLINDDTIPMSVSARDTVTIVTYSQRIITDYNGSITFDGAPLRLCVQGSSAFTSINDTLPVPSRPTILSPAARDSVNSSGFLLTWTGAPHDSMAVHITGRIFLDTLLTGASSLWIGPDVFERSSTSTRTDISVQVTKKLQLYHPLQDSSRVHMNIEMETRRGLAFKP